LDKEFVTLDAHLNPEGKLQPIDWYIKICAVAVRHSECLQEHIEWRVLKSNNMNAEPSASRNKPSPRILDDDNEDILAINAGLDNSSLHECVEREVDFTKAICEGYDKNPLFKKVLADPEAHPSFSIKDSLIWSKNRYGCDVICIPHELFLRGRIITEVIIDHMHKTIGHFSQFKTSEYI
jgi:hypothetical protein